MDGSPARDWLTSGTRESEQGELLVPDGERRARPSADLRHTAATLMRSQGVAVEVIAQVLGHSSPAVTMNIYLHVFPQQHRDAAEAMRKALGG